MQALAEIVTISPEMQKQRADGTISCRSIITFQIGEKLLHATVWRTRQSMENAGYVKGKIGTLEYDVTSQINYSKTNNEPYVQYSLNITSWRPKAESDKSVNDAIAQASEQVHDAAAAATPVQANIDPETGLPF